MSLKERRYTDDLGELHDLHRFPVLSCLKDLLYTIIRPTVGILVKRKLDSTNTERSGFMASIKKLLLIFRTP